MALDSTDREAGEVIVPCGVNIQCCDRSCEADTYRHDTFQAFRLSPPR